MYVVEFRNYKAFLKAVVKNLPNAGRGQARRLSEYLGVAPIAISQVLSGDRDFSPDQAVKVAKYFAFDEKTTEYFIFMVNHARAETKELKEFYTTKLERIRRENQKIKNLVIESQDLSDSEKAIFYSNWYYSGIYLLSSIEGYNSLDAIADYFELSKEKVALVVEFLVKVGLCVEDVGKIRMGTKSVHIASTSPLVTNHRRSWRDKAVERFSEPSELDIFFSGPVSVSRADAETFKNEFLELIKSFSRKVGPSEPELLMCLNLDWFGF